MAGVSVVRRCGVMVRVRIPGGRGRAVVVVSGHRDDD
jgi:hypothetical protein